MGRGIAAMIKMIERWRASQRSRSCRGAGGIERVSREHRGKTVSKVNLISRAPLHAGNRAARGAGGDEGGGEREGLTLMSNEVPRGRSLVARAVIVITSRGRF